MEDSKMEMRKGKDRGREKVNEIESKQEGRT